MMRIVFFFFSLIICFSSYGDENTLKKFVSEIKTNNTISLAFTPLMLAQLNQFPIFNYPPEEMIRDLITINENLRGIPPQDLKPLLMSEFYKVFFDFSDKDISEAQNVYISAAQLNAARKTLKEKEQLFSPFSTFLINDMIKNFEPYEKDNYINNYLNSSDPKFKDDKKQARLKLLNKHVGPWIMLFIKHDSQIFNILCSKMIRSYFKSIVHVSALFRFHKLTETAGINEDIFTHPNGPLSEVFEKILALQNDDPKPTEAEKNDPKKHVEGLKINPVDGASGKIDEIIKNLDQKAE